MKDATIPTSLLETQISSSVDRMMIRGGKKLSGAVTVSGAKNAVLKMMAAALLTKDVCVITNVPNLTDVHVMADVIKYLGAKVHFADNKLTIDATNLTEFEAPYELVSQFRASIAILGPLLGRIGQAKIAMPGGDPIGQRRLDLHEYGLKKLGAQMAIGQGYIEANAARLIGSRIYLDKPSNGATENIMLAAVLAEGTTVIDNAAQDPEIVNLAEFINAMGGKISGAGTYQLTIDGVSSDDLHGCTFATIPDRIEAGTFMCAAMVTASDFTLENVDASHLRSFINKITEMGAEVSLPSERCIRINALAGKLQAVDISTRFYPGFPTDLQAPIMTVLALAKGTSVITENIYENRFLHVPELKRMGADISLSGPSVAIIKGVHEISGAELNSRDIRAAAALVIAGLRADGTTEVTGLHHLDRGYEQFVEKLTLLGADIHRH